MTIVAAHGLTLGRLIDAMAADTFGNPVFIRIILVAASRIGPTEGMAGCAAGIAGIVIVLVVVILLVVVTLDDRTVNDVADCRTAVTGCICDLDGNDIQFGGVENEFLCKFAVNHFRFVAFAIHGDPDGSFIQGLTHDSLDGQGVRIGGDVLIRAGHFENRVGVVVGDRPFDVRNVSSRIGSGEVDGVKPRGEIDDGAEGVAAVGGVLQGVVIGFDGDDGRFVDRSSDGDEGHGGHAVVGWRCNREDRSIGIILDVAIIDRPFTGIVDRDDGDKVVSGLKGQRHGEGAVSIDCDDLTVDGDRLESARIAGVTADVERGVVGGGTVVQGREGQHRSAVVNRADGDGDTGAFAGRNIAGGIFSPGIEGERTGRRHLDRGRFFGFPSVG